MNRVLIVTALVIVVGLSSCASRREPILQHPEILHVVLVKLKNPSDAPDLFRDAREALGSAGRDRSVSPGVPFTMGRPEVDGSYDAAFVVEFADQQAYRRYLASKGHEDLVRVWRPHIESMRVYDIGRASEPDAGTIVKRTGVPGPRD